MKPLEVAVGQSVLRELIEAHLVVYKASDDDRDPHYHLTTKGYAWLAALQMVEGAEDFEREAEEE